MTTLFEWFAAVASGLVPTMHADPKKQYQWRVRVGLVLCGTFGGLCIVTAAAFGMVPAMFSGFAQVSDLDEKIQRAVAPIRSAQVAQGAKTDRIEQLLIEQLARSKAAELREAKRKFCKAEPASADRDHLQTEMDRLQDEYVRLRGMRYLIPNCGEL
jgi:hypothetical protein